MITAKLKRMVLLLLVFLLCLTGCGESPSQPVSEGTENVQASGETERAQDSSGDSGMSPAVDEGTEYRGSYTLKEINLPNPELGLAELRGEEVEVIAFSFHLTPEGILYRDVITIEKESHTKSGHYIQMLESSGENWILTALPFECSGEDGEYRMGLTYFYQGIPAFRDAADGDGVNYLVSCDEKGNMTEILGAFPEPVQSEYSDYIFTIGRGGNFYAFKEYDGDRLLCLSRELEVEQEAKTYNLLKMRGVITDASEETRYWYGGDSNKIGICDFQGNVVAEAETGLFGMDVLVEMGGDGRIYLASKTGLWELKGKEWELLCDFGLCDYPFSELYDMKEQGDGSILLYGKLDGADCLVRAVEGTQTGRNERQEIVFAVDYDGPSAMLKFVSRFNRQSEKYHITLAGPGKDESTLEYGERLMLDIVAGKGPDILSGILLWDASDYIENGYFASLDGIIEDESQYLGAAFEGGRTNGTLYGMPYDFMMHLAVYSEDFTKGRTAWTLEELMDAVKASDAEILQYGCSGLDIVLRYGLYDDDNTAYIDWEKGESHLTEKPFLELLDFAYRYQDLKGSARAETEEEMLQSGRAAAAYSYFCDNNSLRKLDTAFAGKAALLGYPRSEGSGIYAESRYLYVNSASGCAEGAAEFFRFLLSEGEQSRILGDKMITDIGTMYAVSYLPVNLNAFRQLTRYWQGSGPESITEKQAEQVSFLVENARPGNWKVQEIQRILSEELEPYFAGDKTAEQAAEILDSRVQNYLDETR